MLIAIVQHTPVWVWGLLAALVALGFSQTRPRQVSVARATVLPLVMTALSLSGVFSAFGESPVAIGAWLAGLALSLALARGLVAPRGARFDAATAMLQVPGSWLPLVLILGVFALKYFVGVSLALHPALIGDAGFVAGCGLAYGVSAGLFLGRAHALRSLARRPAATLAA